jgi:hypothetical protein
VTALRLHPVDRRRTVAEPVEEPDAWWALYLAVCAWQKTLPSGDDHIWAFPCSHCEPLRRRPALQLRGIRRLQPLLRA